MSATNGDTAMASNHGDARDRSRTGGTPARAGAGETGAPAAGGGAGAVPGEMRQLLDELAVVRSQNSELVTANLALQREIRAKADVCTHCACP